ncbi:MAG: 50S ribosome-binding GTPase [Candidatus Lokiarchaeota archaeon]|nr:50S ribosome-binding GTPase [Candidatus Lokiarchaeota archaeon]
MRRIPKSSVIMGFLFSALDKFGPMPKYSYPDPVSETEKENSNEFSLTLRDYTQISIKNLSLLISDKMNLDDENLKNANYFAILPYPDYKITALTYFHFIWLKNTDKPIPTAFSILVDEKKRSFLYNNNDQIRKLILESFKHLDKEFSEGFVPYDSVHHVFENLVIQLIEVENKPSNPITADRKLKIIFFGLDSAGKTSFFFTIDRRFSKLLGVKPTRGESISTIRAAGATISLWDLGGQLQFREKYLSRSEIYLYEADLIFFFIDLQRADRFKESIQYLTRVKEDLKRLEQNTPIIHILTKADPDIIETSKIQQNIKNITNQLTNLNQGTPPEIHTTSIFSLFSVLRAFSSGIAQLSPNRDLIQFNLQTFSKENGISLILLLSQDGLLLADHASKTLSSSKHLSNSGTIGTNMKEIFEITAPQFTTLFKIFEKFKALREKETIFKIADSVILFKRAKLDGQDIFLLFLIDEEQKKNHINQNLPEFLSRNSGLISRYMA